MRRLGRYKAALVLSTLLVGCFRYVPAPIEVAPVTEDVRVHLTRVAMAQVPEDFPTGGEFLVGRIVQLEPDSVVLRVPVASRVSSPGMRELRQDVRIPRSGILDVERREVNGLRTALTVVAGTGLGTALVLMIIDASGAGDEGPGDLPDQMRLPVLSVFFR